MEEETVDELHDGQFQMLFFKSSDGRDMERYDPITSVCNGKFHR